MDGPYSISVPNYQINKWAILQLGHMVPAIQDQFGHENQPLGRFRMDSNLFNFFKN